MVAFLTGAGFKAVIALVQALFNLKREGEQRLFQERMANRQFEVDKQVALQGGKDTLDEGGKWVRRILALVFSFWYLWLVAWIVMKAPQTKFDIMVDKNMGMFWGFLFPSTGKGVISLTAGTLLLQTRTIIELILGFYFTKINLDYASGTRGLRVKNQEKKGNS